jgi:hypothetical protein
MRSRLSEAVSFLIIVAATPILTASAITASPHSAHFFLPKCVRQEQAAIPIASAFRDQTVREYHPDKDGSSNG